MCRSRHWARARHRSDSELEFDQADDGFGWREFFMRGGHRGFDGRGFGGHGRDEEGAFAVRRPLRFLAHKLGLDEKQIGELARILDELKIERAQVAVDDRRALAELAEAISAESFNWAAATSAGERRVASAQRLKEAVGKALSQIHVLLSPDQRGQFAYMIRAGVLGL